MSRNRVFFDGAIRWEDEALISPLSTGLLYGDGLFEVLRTYDGVPFRFPDHYKRLKTSADALRLSLAFDEENLWLIIRELLRQNEVDKGDGYVRITIFGAELNLISNPNGITTHTFAHVRRFTPPKQAKYKEGIKVRISGYRTSPYNPIAGHNTICYLPMILTRRAAWERGLDEVLVQSTEGSIAEGSTSNLFMVRKGKVYTPPLDVGIQNHVAREMIFQLAESSGISCVEKKITTKILLEADEVFIVNNLIEIMPVREVDDNLIADGIPGEVTKTLLSVYREKVHDECKT
ncbi:MAG TPA: aminotransferase class IV [bacterium]|jgi:branched-chain amino acid aminotransferase